MGAATASVLGSLLSPTDGMTAEQKQARENAIQSLVAGVAGATGGNAATAMNGATFEIENNQLALPPPTPIWTPGEQQKPFKTPGKSADPNTATLTGNPDKSKDIESKPFYQPLVEGFETVKDIIFTPVSETANSKYDSIINQVHHICTDKNCVDASKGGPWTPKFQELFDGAGMSLQDEANKVFVEGHKGPHPQEYHDAVFKRLEGAVRGIPENTPEYRQALNFALDKVKIEIDTPGTTLNNLVTKK